MVIMLVFLINYGFWFFRKYCVLSCDIIGGVIFFEFLFFCEIYVILGLVGWVLFIYVFVYMCVFGLFF